MKKASLSTTTTTSSVSFQIYSWFGSVFLHIVLFAIVYGVFWASYSDTTLAFLETNFETVYEGGIWLVVSLALGLIGIFAQVLSQTHQIRIVFLYVLVFFVAFVPMLLWVDRHVISTICALSGVGVAVAYPKRNYFYIFWSALLCLIALYWSIKGFSWAMAAGIPFSIWYLKKDTFREYIIQLVILVCLIAIALVWDTLHQQNYSEQRVHELRFSEEKIKKHVPEWLLDEILLEIYWSKNDFRLWLHEFRPDTLHYTTKSVTKITDFLLHYDTQKENEDNPLLEWHYVVIQAVLLVFWWLFLGETHQKRHISRYRLLTYWVVLFLIWCWNEFVAFDSEDGYLIALCAYGGLLPLVGARHFRDISSFKSYQQALLFVILALLVIELSASVAVFVSKSIITKKRYEEALVMLEKIKLDKKELGTNYLDWNAKLVRHTQLPFKKKPPISTFLHTLNKSDTYKSRFNKRNYFIFPAATSKDHIDMLTLYFSEHRNRILTWKKVAYTDSFELWEATYED